MIKVAFRVVPNASKNEVVGLYQDAIKIKLKAPPVDGKANEELVTFLSKLLSIPKNSIEIAKGETNRNKIIILPDGSVDKLLKKV